MNKLLIQKGPFMGKVFLNLIFQSMVAYTAAKSVSKQRALEYHFAYIWGPIALFLLLAFVRVSFEVKFALLTLISALIGIGLKSRSYGEDVIKDVIKMFSAMFVLGFISVQMGMDLRVFGFILTLMLIGFIMLIIFSRIEKKHFGFRDLFELFLFFAGRKAPGRVGEGPHMPRESFWNQGINIKRIENFGIHPKFEIGKCLSSFLISGWILQSGSFIIVLAF